MINKSLKTRNVGCANRHSRKVPAMSSKPQARDCLAKRPKKRAKRSVAAIRRRPNPNALSAAANDFMDKAEIILDIYKEKDLQKYESKIQSPYDRPLSAFKRESYNLIRTTAHLPGGHKIIKSIHHHMVIEHRGPDYSANPFYWGLLAMDHERDAPVLTRQQVGLLARQMHYADRHGVPPCLFVGFLYQAGITAGISQEKSENGTESWGKSEMVRRYEPVE